MSECLKNKKPDDKCMEYAIISHNINLVSFLMHEHNLHINLYCCGKYNNLESFFVYYVQTNDINECFAFSTMFNIPFLWEIFLSNGANINVRTALFVFEANNNNNLHSETIEKKAEEGITALHYAAINNSQETAKFLISHGANINEKAEKGKTALHYAAINNSQETAKILISHGANINEKDDEGRTALHYAAIKNSQETAKILISHGANINEKAEKGKTALHLAVYYDSKETTKLLISRGANFNEKDDEGRTVLHYAAIRSNSRR
ncbi:ankyrin repeat protein, putative [Trichomonas vaginalis G3]|uniref:Ankyrin repeat protein, putative n=1 Tax=Trichomonas vaginalis (strain ATCC PRA-98 / G3) TaxID=412133 RepID=A2HF11_TRIV3|nr:protein kinase protein [Trichomonas vaginalis G3]EAX72006.1 ankyrin repeat protein, putative [Trichomonas vaginalis G3]KAI5530012.1 protein kinase protein [Trichomonas vaginalis G3]|eukprot:XP_001284936.1 ankyrin repeat protein [Trichomonas vaginalis G3]